MVTLTLALLWAGSVQTEAQVVRDDFDVTNSQVSAAVVEGSTLYLAGIASGAGAFGPATRYATGDTPFTVAIGDVTGDGKLDVVTTNWRSSNLTVLSGPGDGTFTARADYRTGVGPDMVALGDLNGDGRVDALTVNGNGNSVSVLLNAGTAFPAHVEYAVGSYPLSGRIGDLNLDGQPDLVVGNYGDASGTGTTISILLNLGGGTFGSRADLGGFKGPFVAGIGDLNADGRPDIVATNAPCCGAGFVSVLLGNGDGTFMPKVDYPVGVCPSAAVVNDFNRDGHMDLAVSNHCGSSVSVLLGNGDGTFLPKVDFTTDDGPAHIVSGDVDGDGKIDLVTANQYTHATITALLGRGDGTFGSRGDFGTGADNQYYPDNPYYLAIGDLNGDGWPDVATANPNSSTVSVLLNVGPRSQALAAAVDLDPNVINLNSHAPWVTAYIEPAGFNPASIELSTVRLAGSVPAVSKFALMGDHDGDGARDLMVKFSREALDPLLTVGVNALKITGSLVSGEGFEGTGEVRVIDQGGGHNAGTVAPCFVSA